MRPEHPTPRKGITAEKGLTASQLAHAPNQVPIFEGVRAIPHIIDGIRCPCGGADLNGHYSLLSCSENDDAMAKSYPTCQGEDRVAARLPKAGQSLHEIRAAIDAQFGGPASLATVTMPRFAAAARALTFLRIPLAPAAAQIRAREWQTISHTVDGTTITLTYSRPRLRGRTNVWGTRIVNWGELWTPGASDATGLESNEAVTIGGVAVPKGKYSVWMIVSQDTT